MSAKGVNDAALLQLVRAIAAGETDAGSRQLVQMPSLAREGFATGASRTQSNAFLLKPDRRSRLCWRDGVARRRGTYQTQIVQQLIGLGADVRARNRRGADPNAADVSRVTPLHRAVRTRCAEAVKALLEHGADVARTNGSGSTPLKLARLTTGRGGSGSVEAKAQQQEILRLLAAMARVDAARPRDASGLVRAAHQFHRSFDVAPLLGLFGVALGFAGNGVLRGLRDRTKTVLFDHLPRDHMNLGFRNHLALLMFGVGRNLARLV